PVAVDQAAKLPGYLGSASTALLNHLARVSPALLNGTPIPRDLAQLQLLMQAHLHDIVSEVLPGAGSVVGTIVGGSLQALSFVLGALVVPVVTFFLLRGWPNLIERVDGLIP